MMFRGFPSFPALFQKGRGNVFRTFVLATERAEDEEH